MKSAFAVMILVLPLAAPAQTPPVADAPAKIALPADPFAQVIAARSVADFARRNKDARAMIVAARMLKEVPMQDDRQGTPADADAAAFSPQGLFAEATKLARGDVNLLKQVEIAESNSKRGVFSSPFGKGLVRSVQNVSPRSTYRFDLNAVGGQPLRIGAIGDIGTSMSMRLVDGGGRVVCADDRNDYAPVCATTPRAAGAYRVELLNRSAIASRTVILSN